MMGQRRGGQRPLFYSFKLDILGVFDTSRTQAANSQGVEGRCRAETGFNRHQLARDY